jgi:hypothetical protein
MQLWLRVNFFIRLRLLTLLNTKPTSKEKQQKLTKGLGQFFQFFQYVLMIFLYLYWYKIEWEKLEAVIICDIFDSPSFLNIRVRAVGAGTGAA